MEENKEFEGKEYDTFFKQHCTRITHMTDLPECVEYGDRARLFPVLAETNRERRVTSIFLAVLTQIPALAETALRSIGVNVGKRTRIEAFTEVVLKERIDSDNRPDGLLVVRNGSKIWTALLETKIARNDLGEDQVERYVRLARANGIDAVITISNQFVARADHSPVRLPKTLLRKTRLFHWSWSWLTTQCEILHLQSVVEDAEQAYLLAQFLDFLRHSSTGVERFTQMGPNWKSVVQDVTNGATLKKGAPETEEAVACWFAETRDLSLHLSSRLGVPVTEKIPRSLIADPAARLRAGITELVEQQTLSAAFTVPNAAAEITVCASLGPRTISAGMRLAAPTDRKSTKARVNWLLRMLGEDDERLLVRAHWPGRIPHTTKPVAELRESPDAIQPDNPSVAPNSFEVILLERTGKRFGGRKTFIEDLERIVPEFYALAGAKLRKWQPAPPKPVKPAEDEDMPEAVAADEVRHSGEGGQGFQE